MKEAWPLGLFLSGLVLAFALAWVFSRTASDAIRYTGMLFQLFGLATVAIGLSQTRRLFGRPSVAEKAFRWLGRVAAAFKRPEPITLKGEGAVTGLGAAEAHLTWVVRPGAPVEERVSALEENLQQLQKELDAKVLELRRGLAGAKESIEHESRQRASENQSANLKIEEVAVGGLHLEIVGLAWLILGVIGTSIPGEIAAWLPPMCR